MSDVSIRCARRLRQVIGEPVLRELAAESGFCKRQRILTGFRAVWAFSTALACGTTRTIADIVRVFVDLTEQPIAYKAFHVRLAHRNFPAFMRSVFERLVERTLDPIVRSRSPLLKSFEDVVIHDGSSFALSDELQGSFPGRFTTISPGAVEVHCTYSLYRGQPLALTIAPDKEAERQFLPQPVQLSGKLILLDRGYVWYDYFRQVVEAGGHFIVRARDNKFNPRIVKCYRGLQSPKEAAGKRLNEIEIPKNNVDLLVEGDKWKGGRYRYRLVLFYVRRKNKHVRLQTSLDPSKYRPSRVAELYRLRWQVELFFKECKSYTCLRKFQTKDPHIVEGLIWGTMIAILLRRLVLYSAFRETGERPSTFIAASMSWAVFRDLARAVLRGRSSLVPELARILTLLRNLAERTNPQRKSTFDRLSITAASAYG